MAEISAKFRNDKAFLHALFSRDDVRFLQALSWIFLEGELDPRDREAHLGQLRTGFGRAFVIAEFAGSDRAHRKGRPVPAPLAAIIEQRSHPFIWEELRALESRAFVRLAFRTIFGREPTGEEFQTWLNALQIGCKRQEILRNLRQSPEGRACGAEIPAIDRMIRRRGIARIPLLRHLVPASRGASKRAIQEALSRIESSLIEFRGSRLGGRLATAFADQEDGVALERDRKVLTAFYEPEPASRQVTGNVALSARVWSGDVSIRRILILKLDHIGDFFVGVRPMVMLRQAWPDAHITLVCGPWNASLAKQLGIFDQIVAYRFFHPNSGDDTIDRDATDWAARCDGIRALELGTYDLAIDLRHDADTRPVLTRIESKIRAGFASPEMTLSSTPLDLFLMEVPADFRDQLHAETRLVALSSLVIETLLPPAEHPIRRLIKSESSVATRPFEGRPFMIVAPGAGSPNRTWPAENFAALMRKALETWKIGLVLIGGAGEAAVNEAIAAQFSSEDCVNLTGGQLTDLATLADGAALFVGNDTGGGHIAALVGTPTLSIYAGVSDPRVWQPLGKRVSIVHVQTPCSYCHVNLRADCHYDLRCLSEITVDMAWTELERLHARHVSSAGALTNRSEEGLLDALE